MPPSPGKIHPLPVKVLYNVDTSPQSYVTVLDGRQDVFVHPKAASEGPQSGEDSIVGSCYMKPAARGICYASPECIPNSSTLDFSVYNLDPSIRPRTARAFSTSASPAPPMEDAWTGKGFLSWVLSESANGTTLVKGRLIRDHDFSPLAFNDGGGLEGLMAAMAEAANRSNGASGEGADGKGWGLEVCITLRLVDPEGKAEFRNRGEFEDMLRRGTLASVSSNVSSSPSASTPRNAQRHIDPARRQTLPPQVPGPIRSSGPSSHLTSKPGHSASFRSSPIQQHQALPPPPPPISQSVSRPSQPSYHPPPLPSTTQIAGTSNVRQPVYALSRGSRPDPHRANDSSSSVPIASSSTHLPPSGSSTNARASSSPRSVTPPPPPQKKSPPPSTPSRDKLHALLRTDEKMSPGLARQLANHPTLLKLLKSVPASAIPKHGLGQAIGLGDGNAAGPSNNNKRETAAQQQDKQSTSSNDGEAPTPTPSAPPSVIKGKGKANASATVTKSTDMEGCCNCGITESELWRTKNMKDGSKKKVCNACGLYFNKNKRMRPPELWDTNAHTDLTSPKRAKFDDQHHTPVRSSPRLNRNSTDHPNGFQHPPVPPVAESPRKRQRSKQIPQPSPRMATRLSTRIGEVDTINGGQGKHLDFSENLFSPSSLFGTSPADALGTKSVVNTTDAATSATLDGIGNMNGTGGLEGEIDIEAFLAQFAGDANGNGMGFDLNALFANTGDGGEGNIMDLLNAFEGDGGGAQEAK